MLGALHPVVFFVIPARCSRHSPKEVGSEGEGKEEESLIRSLSIMYNYHPPATPVLRFLSAEVDQYT